VGGVTLGGCALHVYACGGRYRQATVPLLVLWAVQPRVSGFKYYESVADDTHLPNRWRTGIRAGIHVNLEFPDLLVTIVAPCFRV
jgi:hypothetical protein